MSEEMDGYKIALGGNLPKEQANGWSDPELADDMFRDRSRVRYAVVAYNVNKYTEKVETEGRILTLQIKRVEPTDAGTDDERTLSELLLKLFEERTGQTTLFAGQDNDPDPDDDEDDAKTIE
jgi:hypothetical protein